MYLEFILLIFDYFRTISKRVFLFEWIVPFIISILVFTILYHGNSTTSAAVFKENTISLMGILVGFSITIITILTTGQGKNFEEIKSTQTKIKINNETISLFRLLLINFTYSVIIEVFVIIACLIYPLITQNLDVNVKLKYLGFTTLVFIVIHLLLLTIRNLTDFYLILNKPKTKASA